MKLKKRSKGNPMLLKDVDVLELVHLYNTGVKTKDICDKLSISSGTFYNYIKRINEGSYDYLLEE